MAKLPRDTITHYEHDGKGNINITITDLIRCKDCIHNDRVENSDGRYWCDLHACYMYYCSDGELRGDSDDN